MSTKKGTLNEVSVDEERIKFEEPVITDLHSYGDGDIPRGVLPAGLQKGCNRLRTFMFMMKLEWLG